MMNRFTIVSAVLLAAVLGACGEKAGQPDTDTTGTVDTPSETTAASANTTAASGGTSSAMLPADKEFVSQAGLAGLAEVQMGNLALERAQTADVRAFAQRMVADHTRANEELQRFVAVKGLALPAELAGDAKSGLDHLTSLTAREFDKVYMQHMVADHQKAVSLFQNAATNAADVDLKEWATKMLPALQQHLQDAETVNGKL